MVDTVRTEAELLSLFADNSTGAISPQDLRDFVVSIGALISEKGVTGDVAITGDVSVTGKVSITQNASDNALDITQNASPPATLSGGGAIHVDNSGSTREAIIVQSSQAAPAGSFVRLDTSDSGFNVPMILITRHEDSGSREEIEI